MRKTAALILFRSLSSLVAVVAVTGCVAAPAPYEEFALARAAVKAAQEFDSARFATGLWNKAEDNYRSGQKAWKDAEYEIAKQKFVAALQYAEKAENITRLKKFQSGDSFP